MDRIIDSHAHLNEERFTDIENSLKDYLNEGLKYIMVPGYDYDSSVKAIALTKYNSIYAAIGIHPENIDNIDIGEINKIEELLGNNKIKAIGEIGLDYHYTTLNKDRQKEFLIKQIDLSFKYNLPIIIHMRDSDQELLDLFKEYKRINNIESFKGVMHTYSGSVEMMREFIKLGFYISFSGVITFKNSKRQIECAKECPLDRILVETDSPYMAPEPFRGQMNEPKYVKLVLDKVSLLKDIKVEDMENIIYNNFCNLFNIEV